MTDPALPSKRHWTGLVFICLSLLLISLANSIMNVALPSIALGLGATTVELQWVVDGYLLTFASMLLTMGAVGDRYGRKRALMTALAMFAVGGFAATLAYSAMMLIAVQIFLGAAAALIMPATLSLISATFTDPRERSQAIAIWAATFGLGLGVGPVLGGWVLEYFSWEAAFLVYIPVAVPAIIGAFFFLDESRNERAPHLDLAGMVLSIVGLFLLVLAITHAGLWGLHNERVLITLGLATVLLAFFVWWENRTATPMLPLGFFKNTSFTGANLALTLTMFSMFGLSFSLTQYFQSVQDHTALEAGVRMLPLALVLMLTAALSNRVSRRLGIKVTVGSGLALAAVALIYWIFVISVDTPYRSVLVGLVILGVGLGLTQSPATDSVMGSVPVQQSGVGSAMNDTTRELGGALGVALLGSIVNRTYLSHLSAYADTPEARSLPQEAIRAIASGIQGAHKVAAGIADPKLSQALRTLADKAFVSGLDDSIRAAAIVMLLAAVVVFAVLPAEIRRPAPDNE